MRIFIVIPARNEEPAVERVVREVRRCHEEVVVVDDGSTDGTAAAARRSARYLLRHAINRGQGAALQTGIDFALARGAEVVVTFDADGQHRVEDLDALLDPIRRGEADVVLGSRFLGEAPDLPASRRLLLRLAVLFTRVVNGVRLTDAHNGLRAFSRRAAEGIHLRADGMAHASEIIDIIRRSGLRFVEVPVRVRYTAYSIKKGQRAAGALRIAFHYLFGRLFP